MKKIKLLLAAMAAMVGLSAQAQSWTASEVGAGEFYLYNVGTGQYFTKGNGWGTQASITTDATPTSGLRLTIEAVGTNYKIRTDVNGSGYGVESLSGGTIYTDQSRRKNSTWEFTEVSNDNGPVYTIVAKENHGGDVDVYLAANADNTIVGPGTDGTSAYAQWKLLDATIVDAKNTYTNVKAAVQTLNSSIDVSDADAAFAAATTTNEVNAAIALLREAASQYIENVTLNDGERLDITNVYLINADFEVATPNGEMPTGWTITITGQNCGQQNRTDTNPETQLAITNFIEAWHPNQLGSGVIAQTVSSLPEGTYVLECDASICHDPAGADDITGANLFIKSSLKTERQAISNVRLYINHYSLSFSHGGSGEVTFGLEADNTNANWLSADNFKVFYAGPIDLSVYVEALTTAVAEFEALESVSDATDYATYKAIVDENNKTYTKSADYQAAIDAIHEATDALKAINQAKAEAAAALAAAKEAYNAVKAKITALTTVEGYTETVAGATNTLTAAIAAADEAVEATADADAVNEQIPVIKAAGKVFITGVRSDGVHPFDITFLIANPSFDNNNAEGWTTTPAPGFQSYTNCEYYYGNTRTFDIHQTITGLPKGNYELKVQAFQRPGWFEGVYDAYKAGNNTVTAVIFINEGQTTVKNLVSEGGTTSDAQWQNSNDSNKNGEYYANSMNGAAQAFKAGYYWNSVLTAVEGDLTFGFKSTSESVDGDWIIFDNFQLYYYGQSINVAMDEAEAFSALADIEGANVTLERTTKVGYNTVALPFDLTEAQVKEVFGTDAVVYAYSENSADANDAEIVFTTAATKIEANVPVLVKASKAATEIKADNVTVKTGAAVAEGTNFDFAGNYDGQITLPEGIFFLNGDKVYKSTGLSTIKGFRAYFAPKGAEVKADANVKIFIDGLATSISELNGAAALENAAIYNLAGQRVNKAQKGIFIVNGKKVVK